MCFPQGHVCVLLCKLDCPPVLPPSTAPYHILCCLIVIGQHCKIIRLGSINYSSIYSSAFVSEINTIVNIILILINYLVIGGGGIVVCRSG